MNKLKGLWRRLRFFLRRDRFDRELEEEMRQHLAMRAEENKAEGMSAEDARYAALRQFGNQTLLLEESRGMWSFRSIETFIQDARYGARMLVKHPGFTLVAILTLALGIGANTAIFSVVNAALLRPLPYDTTRLMSVESVNLQKGKGSYGNASPADFLDWKRESRCFEQIAAYTGGGIGLKELERVEVISGARVSVNFFETLGVGPMLGRVFTEEEGVVGGPKTIILSHRLWVQRFGGDPNIIGRSINTDEGPVTVVGVMPVDFRLPAFAQAWLAWARDSKEMRARGARYVPVIGKIRQGETRESADAEMQAIAARLAEIYPKDNRNWTARVTPWREHLTRDSKASLLILMGAVALTLLIACANLANLLLARAAARRKEIAIRLALGASRWRLLRQLLIESLLLATAGGALGLLFAFLGVLAITDFLPQLEISFRSLNQMRDEIRIDRAAALFTLGVSILTGLLFGLLPAWQSSQPEVGESLKEGGRSGSLRQRARGALVAVEIALAMVLLAGAGLLMNSFLRMRQVEVGYDPRGLMTMNLSFPAENKQAFAAQVLERIAATPGVESVALMSYPTFGGLNFPFNIEGRPLPNGDVTGAYSAISPTYFRTLKTRLRAGREFTDQDLPKGPGVAIINETLARQYFSGEDPIGKKLTINYMNSLVTREIVGVTDDIKQEEPSEPTKPEIYVPFAQLPWFSGTLLIRTLNPDPLTTKAAVQQAIWSVNKGLPESKAKTLEQTLSTQVAEPRLYALLLSLFAGAALLLAAIGVYGVMSHAVTQRAPEIGIRMALGAQTFDVMKLILRQGIALTSIGVAIGLMASLALTRLMKGLLFGVSATDPLTFVSVAGVLAAAAMAACYIPARRATKVDPMDALRRD